MSSLTRSRRWTRLLGLLIAVCFTVSAAAPGAWHNCGSDPAVDHAGMPGMTGMPANHHSDHGDRQGNSRPMPEECHCVGHSCCVAAPVLPQAPVIAPAVLEITAPPTVATVAFARPAVPDHLLPLALGPPRRI